jgi:hypothetical protein
MTASVKSKQGGPKIQSKEGDKQSKRDATRVNTMIYVRGAGKKKAAKKGGSKTTKKATTARPRRERVRDGK